jgi:transmembrane sensor
MSSTNDKVRELITEEAAEWFVANREGLTPKEREEFVAWLRTSPVHVEEYLAHSLIARDLRKACEYSDDAIAELLARARTPLDRLPPSSWTRMNAALRTPGPGWRPVTAISVICVVAAIGWLALRNRWWMTPTAAPQAIAEVRRATRHGEQQSFRLPDNSVLHLNTDSAATIRYSSKERVVILNAGEADFEVVHEAGREFRVVAGAAQVIDRGTQFDVRLKHDMTVVTVVEGTVSVTPTSVGREGILVSGDQQLTVLDGVWPPAQPTAVDARHMTAWLHRQIVFDHAPLDKVAAEFNRYAPKPITIVTPGLQKLEVSGVFTTDDPAAFIAFLRSLNSVRIEETATQILVSRGSQ